jgi:hypothetical protein
VQGDCGAPLTFEETGIVARIYPQIKSSLSVEAIPEIERQGTHTTDNEYGYVTPTINNGICVYGYYDEAGIVKCGIEKAWNEGKTDFRKPISCHLYPIRITAYDGYEAINYDRRPDLCSAACRLGKKLKVPVYKFLKDAIERKYGTEFYNTLDAVAEKYKKEKSRD